jgi:hypothetical protein
MQDMHVFTKNIFGAFERLCGRRVPQVLGKAQLRLLAYALAHAAVVCLVGQGQPLCVCSSQPPRHGKLVPGRAACIILRARSGGVVIQQQRCCLCVPCAGMRAAEMHDEGHPGRAGCRPVQLRSM